MNTVEEKTLKYDLCVNCGICKVSCPQNAIEMLPNKYSELNPKINKKKCTKCGLCSNYCPNTKEKIKNEALKITSIDEPQAYGLQNANYYVAWNKDVEQRQKCCSGGVTTELARYLFENKKIDAMIHVERLWAKRGKLHYGARLSLSIKEIEENVSSAYQPIDFSNVLENLEVNKTYFITGTPCAIRGLKELFGKHKKFQKIHIITCALVCSHNTNAQVIDFLTQINKLPDEEAWQANIRNKDRIPNANNFNNHIYTKEKDLLKKNRFESGWTDIWRSYYFAMNVCNYCSDFWGYEADISVKDAWEQWSDDPLGKSIVVFRNEELEQEFLKSNIEFEQLSFDILKNHQFITSNYKQIEAKNKNFKSIFSKSNRKNGLLKNKIVSSTSKFMYKNFGFYLTKKIVRKLNKILTPKEKKQCDKLFILQLHELRKSIRKIFKYKNSDRHDKIKQILVAGGYGYGNTGDEAQCAETLKLLTNRFPNYQIVNLTPNIDYSKETHPKFFHEIASRVVFFDSWKLYQCYDYNDTNVTTYKKIIFFIKFVLIYLNAFLVRADLPTLFVNAGISNFLYKMKTSSLFYFCGGGYLTGSTLSRLWDGILLCRLAHLFNVPVVMSGQTIGVWKTSFNKKLAKWGFKHVKLITVRDEKFSLKDLEQIGLVGGNCFATHDDALFCEKSADKQLAIENYITINFHYWGMSDDEKNLYIDKIQKLITYVLENTNYNIVFIPMIWTDKCSYDDFIKKYPNNRIQCFEYDYDFKKVRKVISDSKICITMKHHPIIFAMGESTPVISLAFSQYYLHKNLGALMQYKQEDYSINLESDNYLEIFEKQLNNIIDNYNDVCSKINTQIKILKNRKDKFLNLVDDLLTNKIKDK